MIQVKNLTKKFGNFVAVDNIDFTIDKGDIVGFLGPNGAGKTTTMRMLAGYMTPDEGSISFDGKDLFENEYSIKKKIGYMPENNPLYKDLMVFENLDLTMKLLDVPKTQRKERMSYIVEATGIADKFYKTVSELSKGYKQRVGLAVALISQPEFLILDEPTEGLDPNQRTSIRKLIKELGKERTVIVSTHVMQEVEAMCNKIMIINEGKLIANGTKNEIMNLVEVSHTIKLEIKGKSIESDLKKLTCVSNIESKTEKEKNHITITLKDNSEEVYEQISKLIAKNECTIYKLETVQNTLEEVFYSLTK
jgi:ABC-2 type transport system ATP-binding protein